MRVVIVVVFMRVVIVVVFVRMVVMVVMSMVVMIIVRARGPNIDAGRGDDDVDICASIFDRFEQRFFIANAVDEHQIGIGDGGHVAGCGDEVVRVAAPGDERADFDEVTGNIARHISQYAVGRNHDRFVGLSADIDAEKQRQHRQCDDSYFHACSSFLIHGII